LVASACAASAAYCGGFEPRSPAITRPCSERAC
jgi:hypothetical protein